MNTEPMSTVSSGNPFADLGMSDADTRLAKAKIAQKITAIMRDRQLTQVEVARILDISQPRVSEITRGQLKDFSLQRLMELMKGLDMDVEITVIPNPEPGLRAARLVVRETA